MGDIVTPPDGLTINTDIKLSNDIKNLIGEFNGFLQIIDDSNKTQNKELQIIKKALENNKENLDSETDKLPVTDFSGIMEDSIIEIGMSLIDINSSVRAVEDAVYFSTEFFENLNNLSPNNMFTDYNKKVMEDSIIEIGMSLIGINSSVRAVEDAVYFSTEFFENLNNLSPNNMFTDYNKKVMEDKPNTSSIESEQVIINKDEQINEFGNKIKESFDKGFEDFGNTMSTTFGSLTPAILGPMRMITDPLQEITGFSFQDKLNDGFKGITGALTKKRKAKIQPNRNEVAEAGDQGVGALYLGEKLDKIFGKKSEDDESGLSGLLGGLGGLGIGAMKGLGGMLLKGLGIGMIIASIALMIKDGIMGAMKADEWGVGKGSAIAGAVLGGVGSGWKNAFANAGKWALMGAGIGLLAGAGSPIGALIGGLAGAVVGGLLGYFGGEKIAQFIENALNGLGQLWDSTKEFFSNAWNGIKDFFINLWNSDFVTKLRTFLVDAFTSIFDFLLAPFKGLWNTFMDFKDNLVSIWKGDESFLTKFGKTIGEFILFLPKMIWGWIKGRIEGIKNLFIDLFIGRKESPEGKKAKKALLSQFWSIIKSFWGGVGKMMMNGLKSVIRFFMNAPAFIKDTIIPGLEEFFSGFFGNIIENIGNMADFVKNNVWPKITEFFGNIFDNIKETWNTFWEDPGAFISNIWNMVTEGIKGLVNKVMDIFNFIKVKGIGESITLLAQKGFSGFFEEINSFGDAFSALETSITNIDKDTLKQFVEENEIMERTGERNFLGLRKKEGTGEYEDVDTSQLIRTLLADPNLMSLYKEQLVNDAIIKKDGSIIHTSPDDNLIATKNDISSIPISENQKTESLTINMNNNEMINLLQNILDTLKSGNDILDKKEMSTTINTGNSIRGLSLIGAME